MHTDFAHVQQIVTGFVLLERLGIIELELRADKTMSDDHPERSLLIAQVGDAYVAYDVADGYYLDQPRTEAHLDRVICYFKRSFDAQEHRNYRHSERIYPLGMNYHVATKHAIFSSLARANKRAYLRSTAKRILRRESQPHVTKFEDVPRRSDDPTIVFFTRTWNPEGETPGEDVTDEVGLERQELNEMRAACIRTLRDSFGERFAGGLLATRHAEQHYGDCVVPRSLTHKDQYLALVRQADIGIATRGLSNSTGWKMAEYVAASKGIVAEHPRFAVPGGFEDGENYLGFRTPEQCVLCVRALLSDPARLYRMKVANYRYYHRFLRPDQLVLNTLLIAVGQM